MKIAVIMPSYLGDYPGAATNRTRKMLRAVRTFEDQEFEDQELIIISDGCKVTNRLFEVKQKNIFLWELRKRPMFSGAVRMAGIRLAKYLKADIITYLDTDDVFLPGHLQNIADAFTPDVDWIYFNDTLMHTKEARNTELKFAHIGTSNIAHRTSVPIQWGDGYGHDFGAIQSMMNYPHKKADFATYGVCHCPNEPNKFDV